MRVSICTPIYSDELHKNLLRPTAGQSFYRNFIKAYPRKILLYRLFFWVGNTTNARRQLRNGLRIILSYVLQLALTRSCCTPTVDYTPVCKCVYASIPSSFLFLQPSKHRARLRSLNTNQQTVYDRCMDTRCIRGCNVTTVQSKCTSVCRRNHGGGWRFIEVSFLYEARTFVLYRRKLENSIFFLFPPSTWIIHPGIIMVVWIFNF